MRFTSLIWKNIARRPLRTGLTLFALASAIAAVVTLLGIANSFQRSFADVYRSHAIDVVVSRQGAADRLSSSIDEALAAKLDQVDGVRRSAPVLLETLSLEDEGVYGIPAMGMRDDSWLMDDFQWRENRAIEDRFEAEPEFPISNKIYLGANLAARLGLQPGNQVSLFDETYVVEDIFTSRSTWENGSMIVPLGLLQELTGREGQVTYVNVVIDDAYGKTRVDEVIAGIRAVDAKLLPLATEEFVTTDTRMQIASAMAWMTSMVAILIGAIGTLNTMMTSVVERTGEIGILRAIGWSRGRVIRMVLGESCLLAVLASGLGVAFAMGLTWLLGQSPAVRGILETSLGPAAIVKGMVVGLAIGLLGAILPAWRAARMTPMAALNQAG